MTYPWQLLSTTREVRLMVDNTDQDQEPTRPWTSSLYIDDVDMHPVHSYGATPQEAVENLFSEHDWTEDLKPYQKTTILIHAWHVWESSGGFDWAPITDHAAYEQLTNAHADAISIYGATSSALVTLKVAGYHPDIEFRDLITEFIDGGLQDAIEIGRVGHIISRFNNEPEES